jgi:hypothetical protein
VARDITLGTTEKKRSFVLSAIGRAARRRRMAHKRRPPGILHTFAMLALLSVVCTLGCTHTRSTEATTIRQASWHAVLDECQEVHLSFDRVHEHESGEPERSYEQLTLELRPRPHLRFERLLKSVEMKPGASEGQFRFDEIEVRADEARRRVWFVDRETRRVIATLDRDTGSTTGPDDEPPPWATVDGGVPLSERE